MSKPKLILYSQALACCNCYEQIFNTEFDTLATDIEGEFIKKIHQEEADLAVVCFCSAKKKDAKALLRLEALSGPLPVLTCSKALNPEFISSAARQGIDCFLLCDMDKEKIRHLIYEALEGGGLREYLESCCPGNLTSSLYVRKMLDEIVHAFPHRLSAEELAKKLGITRRWLHDICKKAFGKTYRRVIRRIWIHQALRMMQNTALDNTEIALQLNYSEESSMARDFRKELGYDIKEARHRLANRTPEELLIPKTSSSQ